MLRIIDTITDKYLSHSRGLHNTIVEAFFLTPFEKTVIPPELHLPALFFKKILKNLLTLVCFNRKVLFLNLCVDVIGLYVLIKI